MQGWIVTDPDVLAHLDVNDHEMVVEVPAKLLGFLTLDGLDGVVADHVPPIVHVLANGNHIIRGNAGHLRHRHRAQPVPDLAAR